MSQTRKAFRPNMAVPICETWNLRVPPSCASLCVWLLVSRTFPGEEYPLYRSQRIPYLKVCNLYDLKCLEQISSGRMETEEPMSTRSLISILDRSISQIAD